MPAYTAVLEKFEKFVIGPIMQVVFAAGFLLFLWGLVQFLWNLDEGGAQDEGKSHMFWGVIGMFIMVSIWGIISILSNTFNLGVTDPNYAPNTGNVQSTTGNLFQPSSF